MVALGDSVPAPRLEWFSREESWVLLGYEAVPSRQPRRPWTPVRAGPGPGPGRRDRGPGRPAARRLAVTSAGRGPASSSSPAGTQVHAEWPHRTRQPRSPRPWPSLPADHLVHADLRDDNILLADDGRTLACDWNWPALGTPWQDSLDLLISAHGDGVDTEARPLRPRAARDGRPGPRGRVARRRHGLHAGGQPAAGATDLAVPAHPQPLDGRGRLVLARAAAGLVKFACGGLCACGARGPVRWLGGPVGSGRPRGRWGCRVARTALRGGWRLPAWRRAIPLTLACGAARPAPPRPATDPGWKKKSWMGLIWLTSRRSW